MSRGPASYRVSWSDLKQFVLEQQQEHHVYIVVQMHFTHTVREGAFYEVRVYPWDAPVGEIASVRTRVPCTPDRDAGLPGQALHAVAQAMGRLRDDPWLWPADKRKAAAGSE